MKNKTNGNDGESQFDAAMDATFEPHKIDYKNSDAEAFDLTADAEKDRGITYEPNGTTGSGYSEAERRVQDGINSPDEKNGSKYLVDKYNINDKAYSDSSLKDFTKTTSAFHHNDEDNPE
ncbi:MAG TPA: hypothetical protein VK623_11235 [Flavobacterium sp.]|nr:hypothetical protein [Flavobacterium sp.]